MYIYVYETFIIHLWTDGQLDWSHFSTIINTAEINMGMQVSVC